ncbi:UDP-N-acetylglucosamine transferase subunit ALG14 isoform 2-T2 [Molossus nigricans]
MGCVLSLAAAVGAVAVVLALRLWLVLHSRVVVPRESVSLMAVAGSGGHTTELLRLLEHLSSAYSPRHYVIADTDDISARKIHAFELSRADRDPSNMAPGHHIHRIPRSREVQQSWLSTVLSTLHAAWLALPLTYRLKPDLKSALDFSASLLLSWSLRSVGWQRSPWAPRTVGDEAPCWRQRPTRSVHVSKDRA